MVARERTVVSNRKKMIKFGKSERVTAVPVSASQSFESGQKCRRGSFHGNDIIMSSSRETSSSGCCKRRRSLVKATVDGGGRIEKRRKVDICMVRQCLDLLEELKEHPVAGKFFNQMFDDPKNPEYLSITRNPMDLGIIKCNLENNAYLGIQDLQADIRLAFYNAMLYMDRPLSYVLKKADEVKRFLRARWKSLGGNSKHQEILKVEKGKVSSFRSNLRRSRSKSNKSKSDEKVVNVKLPLNNARKSLQKGMKISNGGSGGAQGSISNAKPPLRRRNACKCCSGGSIKCQRSRPTDSNHESSMTVTSARSLGRKIRVCSAVDATNKIDGQAKNTLTPELSKSDPDYDGAVNALDNVCIGSQLTFPATDAGYGEESLTAPTYDVQMSLKKALHAAMLKTRFADTILKAQQTILLLHGDKADPVKMQREKAKLERKLRDVKAEVEGRIRAAEAEAKMERERQREAARIALQKMENTAGIQLNLEIQKEFEILTGCSDLSGGNILRQLGLFLKDEHSEDGDNDNDNNEGLLYEDVEEGEILP